MAFHLLGILTVDPETESLTLDPLTGQYWLAVKESGGDYRALEVDEEGRFFGGVQHILEDDLLEGYMPELAFFKEHLETPTKKLISLLTQKKEQFLPELEPLLAAFTALLRNREYNPGLTPSSDELKGIGAMLKEFEPANPGFSFIYALASAAIRHRKNQNHDQAIFYYMKALDLGGEDPNILFNLARVYHELGAEERAKSSLARALELNPKMKMAQQFLDFLTTDK